MREPNYPTTLHKYIGSELTRELIYTKIVGHTRYIERGGESVCATFITFSILAINNLFNIMDDYIIIISSSTLLSSYHHHIRSIV